MRRWAWTTVLLLACSTRIPTVGDGDESSSESSASSVTIGSSSITDSESATTTEDTGPDVGCGDDQLECPDGACVEEGGFIPNEFPCCDHGGDCGEDTSCDPTAQDCPEGEKCTAYKTIPEYCCWDANKCVPVIGDKDVGDPCTREGDNDDCARGMICAGETPGDEGPGTCVAFCGDFNGPTPCVTEWANQPDYVCIVYADGVYPHCLESCDPLAQDCPDGEGCYPAYTYDFICQDEGQLGDDEPCTYVNDCAAGLFCANWQGFEGCAGDSCCTPFCDCTNPDDPICTDPNEQCVCYYEQGQAPEGDEDVGLCYFP